MSDTVLITLDNLEPKNFFHFMLLMDLKEKKKKEKKRKPFCDIQYSTTI